MKYEHGLLTSTPEDTEKKWESKILAKPLHDMFFKEQQVFPQVDWEQSWRWMQTAGLRYETKARICTAQEQVLVMNNIQHKVYKMDVSSLCHLCKKHPDTVSHILSDCIPIVKKKYSPCHDGVAKYIHWNILRDHGHKVSAKWWLHKPVKITHVNDAFEVNWDKTVIVDQGVEVNRPGITVIDKKNKIAKFVEISIHLDANIVDKTAEKI
eukprot:14500368-Ditylum_brightwellii.AAC.1